MDVPPYEIRPARDGDWHALYRLNREAMGGYIEATWGPWDETVQWRFFLARVFAGKLQVIEVDGERAGILEVTREAGRIHVDNLELAPKFQRRGIGSAILGGIIEYGEEMGLPVALQVLHVNPARRLYERLGFVATGETETHVRMERPPSWKAVQNAPEGKA